MNRFAILSATAFVASSALALDLTTSPGSLANQLPASFSDPELILSGRADVRDLQALRALPADVESLDLSGLTIAELDSSGVAVHLGKSYFRSGHLPEYIFFRSPLKSIVLPQGVTVIESGALSGSEITSIVIPEGVVEIGDYALYGCPQLEKVVLPSTLTKIGKGAFANCPKLSSVNIENTGVLSIPDACFAGCSSLAELNTDYINYVGTEAFAGSGIVSLNLIEAGNLAPYSLANMPQLMELTLNSSASIGEGLILNDTALLKIEGLPDNVPDLFAANCTSLVLSDEISSATSIGRYSFINTPASEIILGKNLTHIDASAFKNASTLTHIDATALGNDFPAVEASAFANLNPEDIKVKVADAAAVDAWKADPVWGTFSLYTNDDTNTDIILAEETQAIRIFLNTSGLNILSDDAISSGAVYDAAGSMMAAIPAGVLEYSVSLESLPAGVLIVSVKAGDSAKTVKVII